MIEVIGTIATVASVGFGVWTYTRRYRLALRLCARLSERVLAAFVSPIRETDVVAMPTVQVRIVNRGRDVRVEEVGWVDPTVEARANHVLLGPREPVKIENGDGSVLDLGAGDLAEVDATAPLTFWVRLTTGERLYADNVRLARPVSDGPQRPVRLRRWPPRTWRPPWWLRHRSPL